MYKLLFFEKQNEKKENDVNLGEGYSFNT